jgi:hypothetical protein
MSRFDFILGKPFRETLERDYAELIACRDAKAWKSVHVLSGSIIEAVLIDYLAATNGANRPKKDPLRLDLAEAVEICKAEGVLSERASQLCAVVRSYRNLIHAGRAVRLAEEAPADNSATIAVALTDIIVAEVSLARQHEYGSTAEQILSKLERDSASLSILRHLLQDMRDTERERLILEVLPERYLAFAAIEFRENAEDETIDRLAKAYRIAHSLASEDTRRKALLNYVRILREGDGVLVDRYDDAFFVGDDLQLGTEGQIKLVKEHFLAKLNQVTARDLRQFKGIERHLAPSDAARWIDPIVKAYTNKNMKPSTREWFESYLDGVAPVTAGPFNDAVMARLDEWAKVWGEGEHQSSGNSAAVQRLKGIFAHWDFPTELIDDDDLPF